jgi:hypothetical protein
MGDEIKWIGIKRNFSSRKKRKNYDGRKIAIIIRTYSPRWKKK